MIGEREATGEPSLVSKDSLVEELEPLKGILVAASAQTLKIAPPINGNGGDDNLYPNEVSNLYALVSQSRYAGDIPKENFIPSLHARYLPSNNLHLKIMWPGHKYAFRYNYTNGAMSLVLVSQDKTKGEMIDDGVTPADFRVLSYLCNVYSGRYL